MVKMYQLTNIMIWNLVIIKLRDSFGTKNPHFWNLYFTKCLIITNFKYNY